MTRLGIRSVLAATASALVLTAASEAQDVTALEDRLAALEAMVADLRNELEDARAQADAATDRVIEIEQRTASAPAAPAAAASSDHGFTMGNTQVTYGGFVDLDAHVTDLSDGDIGATSIARDFYISGATPVGGAGDGETDFDFTAKASRFFFATSTESDIGAVTGRIEFDFLGSPGGNERVSNSYNPRMRVAWAQIGNWRVGQDWSTFTNTAVIPESASFLVGSDGMLFGRQAQIRYTNGGFQFALENPDTTVTPFGGGGRIDSGDGALPDVVARYNWSGDFGAMTVSALGRNLAYEGGGVDGEAFGWGVNWSGRVTVGEGSDLRFSLTGGEGIGRYIGLNAVNGAVVTASGDLEAIPVYGGLVAWRQQLGQGRRLSVGYSMLEADNDITLTGTGVTKSTWSAFGAYFFPVGPVTLGAEILFGERELENGQSGTITRATLSTKYPF
ncbi:DcaP family trimeric outer membrane transporter [Oceanicaulis sp.]|uniref:DcaP family trimeric outer membrane transporter n=1 Tax=Oceanicaulis sp. TaxID=1924941 RepID=UPI003D295A9D